MRKIALLIAIAACFSVRSSLGAWYLYPVGPSDKNTALALNSQTVPYVAYIHSGTRYPTVSYFDSAAHAFTTMPVIAETMTDQVAIAIDTCDNPHVLYRNIDATLYHAAWDGVAWSIEPIAIAKNAQYYDIVIDNDNVFHVSCMDYINHILKYLRYQAGVGWTSEDIVLNSCFHVSIAVDDAGIPHMSYTNGTDFSIKHAWKNGAAWSTEVVDLAAGAGGYSSIALKSDFVYISYWLGGSYNDVKYADNIGGLWNVHDVDVGTGTIISGSFGTRIAVNSANEEPQVAYIRSTFTIPFFNYYLYCGHWLSGSGVWSLEQTTPGSIGNGAGAYGCLDMACDAGDFLYISYNDDLGSCYMTTTNPNSSGLGVAGYCETSAQPIHKNMDILPNPFRVRTEIRLPMAAALGGTKVGEFMIYDIAGRLVKKYAVAANTRVVWDGNDERGLRVPAGVYLIRYQAGNFSQTGKAILLR